MKHNPKTWHCITKKDCKSPKKNMYPTSKVVTLVTTDFASKSPSAFEFIKNFSWSNAVVNELLAWKEKERASSREAAEYFMLNYSDVWKNWLYNPEQKRIELLIKHMKK